MAGTTLWIALTLLMQPQPAENPVLHAVIGRGVEVGEARVPLPQPSLADGRDAAASREVLRTVVGDERSVANFLRDSVTAPFILKTRDVKAPGSTVRVGDLWFAVRGDLDEVDLKQVLGKADAATVEAGNMRFTTRVLADQDLTDAKVGRLPPAAGRDEWYTHASGRLLDRIGVEVTNQVVATRTADSLTVASTTSPAFTAEGGFPNRWATISRAGDTEAAGPAQPYGGGVSYAKITRLAAQPGTLLVEAHFAFVEPDPWFAGNPILRSKLGLICQDQVRQLRREIQKRRPAK